MKLTLVLITAFALFQATCSSQKTDESKCYKGRLEIKGICSNYTIKLIEGNMDTAKIVASWRDEVTGKTHTNVFALGSPCTFPASLKEGDEFYFRIDDAKQECAVCMAYYPTPQKKVSIKVLDKCNE